MHHVAGNLITVVLGEVEGAVDGDKGIPTVGLTGNVFVDGLYAYFDACTSVGDHFVGVGFDAVVRTTNSLFRMMIMMMMRCVCDLVIGLGGEFA